jgi:hypothetical protein
MPEHQPWDIVGETRVIPLERRLVPPTVKMLKSKEDDAPPLGTIFLLNIVSD